MSLPHDVVSTEESAEREQGCSIVEDEPLRPRIAGGVSESGSATKGFASVKETR